MNLRQQKYKKNRIAGMNPYNAAIVAGFSHHTARRAKGRLDIRFSELKDYLEQQGLTDGQLAQNIVELLNANKVIGYLHQYKKGQDGTFEKAKPDETVSNEFIEVPDWANREKGLKLACQIKDHLKEKPIIDQSQHYHFTNIKEFLESEHRDAVRTRDTNRVKAGDEARDGS